MDTKHRAASLQQQSYLVIATNAVDSLERLIFEVIYYVSSGTLNHACSLYTVSQKKCANFVVF